MKELIQNNITPKDLAHNVKLRIEFVKGISEHNLLNIESKLSDKVLKEAKVGFGSAIGIDFIEAAILNFGNKSKFELLKKCINDVLIPNQELIEQISYRKSELLNLLMNLLQNNCIQY